ADGDLRPVVVVAQADRLREVGHRVVDQGYAERHRAPDVHVEAAAELAADRGARHDAVADGLADEAALAGADHRTNAEGDERLERLPPVIAFQRIPADADRHGPAADDAGADAVGAGRRT